MASTVDIIVGSHVWIKDSDLGWVDGEVIQIFGDEVHVQTSNGKEVAERISEVHPKDIQAPLEGVDDLTRLLYLHEPGVLQNLATRYELNKIYTYAGNILIAVNPFQEVPQLYNSHMMELYKGATFGDLSPHVFALADVAYRTMINEGKSISIIVRGESGAGKTQTTKILMEYLAYLSGGCGTKERTIEEQLLASDRIFEAFGNAKTVLNNNSSRFGKFVQIQFDKSGRISGATIQTYFLERSRVCQISDLERNYHCFYYLLCAAPDKEIEMYNLGNPRSFHYLNQSSCFELEGVDDALEYVHLRNAMAMVGLTKLEQEEIFRVVAAVLHLGNIDFKKGMGKKSSVKDEKSRVHLNMAAKLLWLDSKSLECALCFRSLDDSEEKPITVNISLGRRDALAKTLYSRLFDWIVEKVNGLIGLDSNSISIIGVLDIYGFENINSNSFEQFYINYAHEKLQQHFIQEEYSNEIYWSYIEFDDNQDRLDLIEEKPKGIIDRLDSSCIFPTNPKIFAKKLYKKFGSNKRFSTPEPPQTNFTISHHGEGSRNVTYKADLFVDKNKDVVEDHLAFLNESKCSLVAKMFPPLPEDYSKSSKNLSVSVGSRFKTQLQSLMETLNATELLYIWCVKPNKNLVPANFKNVNVLHQLRWNGVIDVTQMISVRYPTRNTFDEFYLRFGALARESLWGISDHKVACQMILDITGLKGYQIGKAEVFLNAGQKAELDARRTEVLGRAATIIQKNTRAYIARMEFLSLRGANIRLPALYRYLLACKEYKQIKREDAALRIKKTVAKETDGLKEAKEKLEKHVEELTWCLQVETKAKIDLEEAKIGEIVKLEKAQYAIQLRLEEARAMARRERKAMKRLEEKVLNLELENQVVREQASTGVQQVAKEIDGMIEAKFKQDKVVEELTWCLQVEKKAKIDLGEAKIGEIVKLEEAQCAMQLQLEEARAMAHRETEAMKRLEKKVLNLELENQVLREQAATGVKQVASVSKEIDGLKEAKYKLEKHVEELTWCLEVEKKSKEIQDLLLKSTLQDFHNFVNEKQRQVQENHDMLIKSISQDLGFSKGNPIVASLIFKCLLQWRSFEVGSTAIFDRVIQTFDGAIESEENSDVLCYWLSNTFALLMLLQHKLKATEADSVTPQRSADGVLGGLDELCPALLFKQQLTALLEKIYEMIRDNLKKEISPGLEECIEVWQKRDYSDRWLKVVVSLNNYLSVMRENHFPSIIIRMVFTQTFSFINVQLLNGILTFTPGDCIKIIFGGRVNNGLSQLERWCTEATEEYVGSSRDELKHIRQAVGFLYTFRKDNLTLKEIRDDLCPVLNNQQLYKICAMGAVFGFSSVPNEVLSSLKVMAIAEESNNAVSTSFLLDDDSSTIPFTLEDVLMSLDQVEMVDVDPPPLLRENPEFVFLLQRAE